MALIVQKYGGTSVGDMDKIKNVARRVAACRDRGDDLIIVLSAMGGETDRLVGLAAEAKPEPYGREYDVVVSAGEQITVGLLALTLQEMGYEAKSYLGSQVPIYTDGAFSSARIASIETPGVLDDLESGTIVIVAGFQGTDGKGSITTLGRGGSDTTAVALAYAFNADICEIYTDVEGVFTTDPRICVEARKLHKVSYDEMLEMASLGAKVLQTRSVELSKKYDVPVMVRSSFSDVEGTLVCKEDADMEKVVVSSVTYNKNEAKISVVRLPDKPGIAVKLFKPMTEAGVNVDMIVQNIGHEGFTDLTFTVPKADFNTALSIVKDTVENEGLEASDVVGDADIAKVSIVGAGMRSHAGVASKMFDTLSTSGINIQMISTSEIKISCVIEEGQTEKAVRALHGAFNLGVEEVEEENLSL